MGRHAAPKQKYKKKISPLIKGRSRNGKSIIPYPKVIEEMIKERMRRRVEEQEKSIRDVRETTEDVESEGPMGYGGIMIAHQMVAVVHRIMEVVMLHQNASVILTMSSILVVHQMMRVILRMSKMQEIKYLNYPSVCRPCSVKVKQQILYFLTSSVLQKPISCLYSSTNHRMY